ncbi:Vitamin K-dependent gamma-carboxylase [Apis mellifera caucasica]|nr:Vitamin K-dependent gamma-carboxylase [Apis mellifera caucasica]KAG9430139.1 Vitamin K-dependent gamma-carboxylase [Apis mellifera carnica]
MWRKSRQLANARVCPSEESDKEDEGRYRAVLREVGNRFEELCGFKLADLSSFESFVALLYRPTDPASLGVVRAFFGLCMVLDVVEERGLGDVDIKWGDPMECHFPLIHGMKPLPLPWMITIYAIMWIGAFGIMLGSRFKIACACFLIPYWYIFLLDKSYWNNHTYLYGIVVILLWGTGADKYFALDATETKRSDNTVPLWNYFILKFQFFALYFLAGLKKSGVEWLSGYAMANLSRHWVFTPFRLFLTTEQTDFFIVHWFGFIFDLTVGFWMLFDKTRIPAMGYNNWVPGMYGYSWDMMVHVWDTVLVVVKVHDNASNEDRYLDPTAWVQSNRYKLEEIQQQIYTWSNDTDVLFVADFPGMHLDNYITKNFTNVTLTVLEGEVTYSDERREHDIMVAKGSSIPIETGQFHKVKTVSAYPACYMYTCTNRNKQQSGINGTTVVEESKEALPIAKEINYKIDAWIRAFHHIANAFFYLVYDVPMVRRVQISN